MCEVLNVSKAGFFKWRGRRDSEDTEREIFNKFLDERIRFHFYDNLGTYGSPRIHKKLLKVDGIVVSEKTVANRMKTAGLYAMHTKKYISTTDSTHDLHYYENVLNQNFYPEEPNKVWVTDITYIQTGEGFVYLNPVIDLFSRRVISFTIGDRMDRNLPLNALRKALEIRMPEPGWIHHSDRGSQYCSKDNIAELEAAQSTISMSHKGNPYDNACVESFFASLKKEYLYRFTFKTKAEAMSAVAFYIQFYNKKRIHSTLGYVSPEEYEKAYSKEQKLYANESIIPSA
ncbi:hypothetical protein Q75_02250 [Bacillus coahuilensis p1.1.43]|uniref:Integrase catalytic domain-containing protein n=2 Tax=Bacillus coahuilensis TaxID=408580 RepID=A0A147KBM1_9BACI|nr:hypothetical protein Q75_02250 [Bacillus coahuilensis p1.1.43]